jgi:hypothetical protein
LVRVDVFSKMNKLYPLKKATTKTILLKYNMYFDEFGKPKRLLTD